MTVKLAPQLFGFEPGAAVTARAETAQVWVRYALFSNSREIRAEDCTALVSGPGGPHKQQKEAAQGGLRFISN